MAQLGSASALGAEGRRFKSGYPDQRRNPEPDRHVAGSATGIMTGGATSD